MKFKLNDWKKVSQGASHTVLRNKQGHEMRIFHSKLSPKLQKQLVALPGALENADGDVKKLAKGGKVKMAGGGAVGGHPCKNPSCKSFGSEHPNCRCYSGMAEGGKVSSYCSAARPHAKGCQLYAEGGGVSGGDGSPYIDPKKTRQFVEGAKASGWQPEQWYKNFKEGLGIQPEESQGEESKDSRESYAEGGRIMMAEGEDVPSAADASAAMREITGLPPISASSPPSGISLDVPANTQIPVGAGDVSPLQALLGNSGAAAVDSAADAAWPHPGASPKPGAAAPPSAPATKGVPPMLERPDDFAAGPQGSPPSGGGAAGAKDPYGIDAGYGMLNKGINLQIAGQKEQAAAIAHQAEFEHKARAEQAAKMQELGNHFKTEVDSIMAERKGFMDDIKNSHIDPQHYMGSMSTTGKVATGIGLMLGGLGAGLAGGTNQAMDFLNKQIDRDIDAQKAELGKKETLLSANFKQFGNLKEAMDMTRIQMNDMLANQIGDSAARSKGEQAQAIAKQAQGQIYAQNYQHAMSLAMQRTMMNGNGGSNVENKILMYKMMGKLDMAKHFEDRYVPELSKTQTANQAIAGEDKTAITKHRDFDSALDAVKDALDKGRYGHPYDMNRAAAAASYLQGAMRDANFGGGKWVESEQPLFDALISGRPLNLQEKVLGTESNKLDNLRELNRGKMNVLRTKYGFEPDRGANSQYLDWAKKNPRDPRAKVILERGGR